ncbi:MAG: M1 family metallopeptidase [Anaerolineae bacterium]
MRSPIWIRILLVGVLAGALAGCSILPADDASFPSGNGSDGPTVTVEPSPTPESVGPYPEYSLSLSLDPALRHLSGQQRVIVPNHTGVPLDEIVFRLYPNLPQYGGQMEVGAVSVDGQPSAAVLRAEGTALAVPLSQPLPPERGVVIELSFAIEIPEEIEGYVLFGYSQGIWSVPDGYALLAVHDGDGWHEEIAPAHGDAVFAEAALYDVTLRLPASLVVATTGSLVVDSPGSDGTRAYQIRGEPLREFTWLASQAYQVSESTAQDTTLRSLYLSGDEAAGQAALNIAAAALRSYESAFGPYPYPEMIVAEAPLLHFGMEYPGLNLIGLSLYREQRAELEDRVVHEVAHQWWYAQVGNDQVNTPWLDEGLAEYSMAIYYDKVFGEAHVNTLVNQRWLVPYQVAVDNGYDAVVNQPSSAFTWDYEVIIYAKAALFFHALHQELGDEVFRAVLREYVQQYRWGIATPDDFLAVAESVSGQDLDGLYSQWILGSR